MLKGIAKSSGDLGGGQLRNLVAPWYRQNGRAIWSLVERMGERVDKKTLAEITVNSWGPKGCAHALGYARTEAARADFGAFHKPRTDSVTQQRNLIGINPDKKKSHRPNTGQWATLTQGRFLRRRLKTNITFFPGSLKGYVHTQGCTLSGAVRKGISHFLICDRMSSRMHKCPELRAAFKPHVNPVVKGKNGTGQQGLSIIFDQ